MNSDKNLAGSRTVSVNLFRYDPSIDKAPHYEEYSVPYQKRMRVLDALDYIYESLEQPFAYHWFCGTKRCGMCGVTVNGKPSLACWEEVRDSMKIEPLAHFPVVRDLVVDFRENETALTGLRPAIVRKKTYPGFPEPITHEDMKSHYQLMSCIDCRLCVAACPVADPKTNAAFVGPYTLVQLAKVGLDPRNEVNLIPSLLKSGIEHCASCNECSMTCPNEIPVLTGAIDKLRAMMIDRGVYKVKGWTIIKSLPPRLRKWLRCRLNLTLGEKIIK